MVLSHWKGTFVFKGKSFLFLLTLIPVPAGPLCFLRYFGDTFGEKHMYEMWAWAVSGGIPKVQLLFFVSIA
jgi:hypothetical protein